MKPHATSSENGDCIYGDVAHAPYSRHGHSRQAYRTSVTLAERFCRKADWIHRRECLDYHRHLGQRPICVGFCKPYACYYNKIRTHQSLDKDAPAFRSVQRVGTITSNTILGGLHPHYVRGLRFSVHTGISIRVLLRYERRCIPQASSATLHFHSSNKDYPAMAWSSSLLMRRSIGKCSTDVTEQD